MVLALGVLEACGPSHRGPRHPYASTDPNAPVSDEAFPAALVDYVLAEPGSAERAKRAPGVVGRQVARSAERFKARTPERAVASFLGAELLLRMGELSPQVLGPRGPDALRLVARDYARRGAEGPSGALYKLLTEAGQARDKAEAKAHLAALESWKIMQLKNRGPVSRASMLAEIAVATYLFDLTQMSRVEAEARLTAWVGESIKLREAYRGDARMPARDEGTEAIRAFSIAPLMLVGLYLRDADPAGAARAIQRGHMRPIVRPELMGLLEEVADSPSSENWLKLASALRNGTRAGIEGEEDGPIEDVAVLRSSAFVASVEAYRLAPTDIDAAVLLSLLLRDYGMAEGIPFVVYPAVKAAPTGRNLSAALGLSFEAMAAEADVDEGAGARRIYRALGPILALAAQSKERLQPSAARIVGLMGNLELRDGNAKEARVLLQRSATQEPAAVTDLLLAKLDRHDGASKAASDRLRSALGREDATRDPLLRAEALIALGDVQRGGEGGAAGESYLAAARILFALPEGDATRAVRKGRLVADLYDRYGKSELGEKALAKATEAAAKDKRVVSAILGHRVARALAHGSLSDAHAALDQALVFDVEPADLVYSATWVRLLERAHKAPQDGSLDRLFSPWFESSRWVGRIAEFSAGKRSGEALVKAAKTPAERCEAWFYAGYDKQIRGDAAGAKAAFERAHREGGVTLVEYELAERLLLPIAPLPAPAALDELDGTAREREAAAKAAAAAAKSPPPKPSKPSKPKPKPSTPKKP